MKRARKILHPDTTLQALAVIEYEDGELHKAYVWRVRFIDKPKK